MEPFQSVKPTKRNVEIKCADNTHAVRCHDEYLRYGGHLSQFTVDSNESRSHDRDQMLMWCDGYSTDTYLKSKEHTHYFQRDPCSSGISDLFTLSQPGDLVLSPREVCRAVIEMMTGHSNDLFFLDIKNGDSEEQGYERPSNVLLYETSATWMKSMACCSSTVPGMTRQMCQQVINWFVELANNVSLCRKICDTVLGVCGASYPQKEEVTLTLQPLYTNIYDQLVQFEKKMAFLDLQLHNDKRSLSLLTLYLETKAFQPLFLSLRAIALSIVVMLKKIVVYDNIPSRTPVSSARHRNGKQTANE